LECIDFLPSTIDEISIITKEGGLLVGLCNNHNSNSILASRILTDLRKISKEMSGGDLHSFSMFNKKFLSIPCIEDDVVIFVRCPLTIKEKKIIKMGKVIAKMFIDSTKDVDFRNWKENSSNFNDFKKNLEIYFKMSNL